MEKTIYHICTESDWQAQQKSASYEHPSLDIEGFIHCSTERQIPGVLERYFEGESDLVQLHINRSKLDAELIFEEATDGEYFPHVYGKINKSAIENVVKVR